MFYSTNPENVIVGTNSIIDPFVFFAMGKILLIKNNVHIGAFCSITGGETCIIESFSSMAIGSRIFTGSDDYTGWGFGNSTVPEKYRNIKRGPVKIERFVIIGSNSVILPGVTVGEGTSIGANSVITKNLEPWGVYIGNRRVKDRDKEEIIKNFNKYLEEVNIGGKK